MRLIAIIISITTLVLSTIPCDDYVSLNQQQLTSISQNDVNNSHNAIDLCSPFCCCACCAGFVIKPIILKNSTPSEIFSQDLNGSYNVYIPVNYLFKIFQPPQV